MLKQRTDNARVGDNTVKNSTNVIENPNSAKSTAISCPSERELRIPCYCEENVWRLAYRRIFGPPTVSKSPIVNPDKENEQYYVVFVSNDERCCPMLNQRASKRPDEPCFWDYHVILIHCSKQNDITKGTKGKKSSVNAVFAQVLDMDTRLSYPCTLNEYLNGTFKIDFVDGKASRKFSPKFRVVRAEMFLQNFYSDRMHMFQNGKWSSPPPTYDCILTDLRKMKLSKDGSMSNLNDYISMSGGKGKESSVMGEVLTLAELRSKFGE